ncbi:class I SAM-dependent methyltransferase [Paenibacillus sp. PAMC21692]|uniref:class I SAM-dependent methyltransferase n=1 Tax=Paenibacillus sp. PAMC21692 TaxID=2762320 RepID=UPI00164E0BF9|nr:class I SAM-dependent methyltransferase [Paenibacillus sp. PAMC21692]QNK55129.1 class I SAM-dependent methyltransferase [Paenibacillus sp. PAMC21692]
MDRVASIRIEEKKYHDFCYDNYNLFESGSWLHRPVKTVIDLLAEYKDQQSLCVLDLGSGIGRNSIPIAESLKNNNGKVICVDILESAIDKLHYNSQKYDVEQYIEAILSDIEQFTIEQEKFDIIIAVSALEHVSSERELERKLNEMTCGTKSKGANCIIIGSNIREVNLENGQELDPMFEVNISTERMLTLLDQCYAGWVVQNRFVKQLEYEIDRKGQNVLLTTDCITFVAKKTK